jgi:NRAMP (natural resistance-associated macrophage protein)-like metal ion transporter
MSQQPGGPEEHEYGAPTPAVEENTPDASEGVDADGNALRTLGLGLVTGAADVDPSAVGTYSAAGAALGTGALWMAPVTLPMMYAVVYLSAKLGQVSGLALFANLARHYPRWLLYGTLTGVLIGIIIEAGADIGGIAAGLGILIPLPFKVIAVGVTLVLIALQIWVSYAVLRKIFRILALSLFAYAVAAVMAKPDWGAALRDTFVPHVRLDAKTLSLVVAMIGTTLSAYLYTWQSNEEVEEEKDAGRITLDQRQGATRKEMKRTRSDVFTGMLFANIAMYFIMLATGSTLFRAGTHDIETAAQAAEALRPLAGNLAGALFALGIVGVGCLAVPVMTAGAAYDLCQTVGWKYGLDKKPSQAKFFYGTIAAFTLLGMGMNFIGINPMKLLVFSGIVQGFSTPPLMLLILLMTNNRKIMGDQVNGRGINILAILTITAMFGASVCLLVTWIQGRL